MTLFALSGCATDSGNRTQLDELQASIRALQAENARLEAQLREYELKAAYTHATQRSDSMGEAENTLDTLPTLTVVKLKPRSDRPPSVDTTVTVREPHTSLMDKLDNDESFSDKVNNDVANGQFNSALDALKTGNIRGGIQAMRTFVVRWPKHSRADNALYFAGIGLMSLSDFDEAVVYFQRVIAEYPAGDARLDAMLKLASCNIKRKKHKLAKNTLENIIRTYPGTPAAAKAQARLSSHFAASTAIP